MALMWHSATVHSPSIPITLPFSQHSQESVQNTPGKTSFHTEAQRDTSQNMTTGRQKRTDIQLGALTNADTHTRTHSHTFQGLILDWGPWRWRCIIVRQHYNNLHIQQTGKFSAQPSPTINKWCTMATTVLFFSPRIRMTKRHPDNESSVQNTVKHLKKLARQ